MKLVLLVFISILMLSCDSADIAEDSVAYFGGEIDSPKNSYIYLKNSDGKKDTILLDEENRFMFKIEHLKPGIFEFGHGGEFQILVIEPNDSIALRLNTRDFDESLVYSGRGAKKNNYLMKIYLEHEGLDKSFSNSFKQEPEEFHDMIDSLLEKELAALNSFNDRRENSKLFRSISQAIIKYNYYFYKEYYPFRYYGKTKLIHFKDLPSDFYAFRKEVDLNNDTLTELYVYRKYIFMHLNNVSLNEFYKDNDHSLKFNDKSVGYNIEKLRLIDSLIDNRDIKQYLMRSVVKEYILESDEPSQMQLVTNAFLEISDNDGDKRDVTDFLNSRINIRPGRRLPNVVLIDSYRLEHNLYNVLDGPTLIYFWSSNYKPHARNSHRIASRIELQHPYLSILSINVNELASNSWGETLKDYRFDPKNEYLFKNPRHGIQVLAANLDNCILVDGDGIILETNFSLFDGEIDKVLYQFTDTIATLAN